MKKQARRALNRKAVREVIKEMGKLPDPRTFRQVTNNVTVAAAPEAPQNTHAFVPTPEAPVAFAGGTKRSSMALPYHRIPTAGLRRIARRFALGAVKYGEPSCKSHNWRNSLDTEEHAREFLHDAFNHAFEHMLRTADGSPDGDDDLSAIGWFVTVAAYAEEKFGKRWTEL